VEVITLIIVVILPRDVQNMVMIIRISILILEDISPTIISQIHYPDYIDRRNTTFYLRDNSTVRGSANNGGSVGANANFNAVIKGLPINGLLVPTPYYIPDEFVMIDFDYAAPATNIQQGDTITISPSEIYKVITGSYNQTTRTRGLLFCARVV